MQIPYSILDLTPIAENSSASEALANTLELARRAEKWGYHRYWLAEHHSMPGVASAATAVVIGHVAGGTKTIRVGAGGIMLPNHAPLVIAEQFGTLETLYPGRIDLGLGRAPGTDQQTAAALRRDLVGNAESFPTDLEELQQYLSDDPGPIQAVPGTGTKVPIWLLGSSLFSAQLAAVKGLPYAFAAHFAPTQLHQALRVYRGLFQPSEVLEKPYAMVAMNLYAAETDEEAAYLFTSVQQMFAALRFGNPGRLPAPVKDIRSKVHPLHLEAADRALSYSAVGSPATVQRQIEQIVEETQADEIILASHIYDPQARLRSYEIGAQVCGRLASESLKT